MKVGPHVGTGIAHRSAGIACNGPSKGAWRLKEAPVGAPVGPGKKQGCLMAARAAEGPSH